MRRGLSKLAYANSSSGGRIKKQLLLKAMYLFLTFRSAGHAEYLQKRVYRSE